MAKSRDHYHTKECYPVGGLKCTMTPHVHVPRCKDPDGGYACGKQEHRHERWCYHMTDTPICGK